MVITTLPPQWNPDQLLVITTYNLHWITLSLVPVELLLAIMLLVITIRHNIANVHNDISTAFVCNNVTSCITLFLQRR